MSEETLEHQLRELGLGDRAVQRVLAKKEKIGLMDTDPFFQLFIELEWYLKAYEKIPRAIESASDAAIKETQKRAEHELIQAFKPLAMVLSKETEMMTHSILKISRFSSMVIASCLLLLVAAMSMTFSSFLMGIIPYYTPSDSPFDHPVVNFILVALHTPTYATIAITMLTYSLFLLSKWLRRQLSHSQRSKV